MKSLKKQRRIQIIVLAFAALFSATGLVIYATRDGGIAFFRSPTQVMEAPPAPEELFRIGGLVEEGSIVRGAGESITFNVTDGAAVVPVTYTGILPDLFAEGEGVVAQGRYINNTFEAVEILAKHDEDYMPREVIEAMEAQGVYRPSDAADTGS
jgi:cytochrome c-type biogenesis protein CcmE